MKDEVKYRFQFNNDVDSCIALGDMIAVGWTVQGLVHEDGYAWLLIEKEVGEAK